MRNNHWLTTAILNAFMVVLLTGQVPPVMAQAPLTPAESPRLTDRADLPPMLESLRTGSKLLGAKLVHPSNLDNETLIEQFFKKNLLENRTRYGALVEGMGHLLDEAATSDGRGRNKRFRALSRKLSGFLEEYHDGKEVSVETIDFCLLYLRLRGLALTLGSSKKVSARTKTAAEKLDQDLMEYMKAHPKQAWGGLLMALSRDLQDRKGLESSLEKTPLQFLEQASGLAGKDPQLHFLMGHLYRDYLDESDLTGFLKLVATEFEKCLMAERRNKELFAEVTAVYVEIHERLQAKEEQEPFWFEELVYRRIIALDPSNASAHNNLSFLYSQYGVNLKDALREAQIANQLKSGDPVLTDTLGWAYYKNGNLTKAIDELTKAVKLDPEVPDVHFHLATVYYDLDDVENAARHFRETLRLDPTNAFARNNLAYLFSEKGVELEEALRLVNEALALQPGNAAFIDTKGWIYFKLGQHEQAVEHLARAVDLAPETSELHLHLGRVYLAMHRFEQATKSFEHALNYDPENETIAGELAYLFALSGLRESMQRYSRIAGVQNRKENFKIFYDALAHLAMQAGDYGNAQQALREYARFKPAEVELTRPTTGTAELEAHDQLSNLGEMLPPDSDMLFSIEQAGLEKLAVFFTQTAAQRYGLQLPDLNRLGALPIRLTLGLDYVPTVQETRFVLVMEVSDPIFNLYWERIGSMEDSTETVTLPFGNLTVPFSLGTSHYKGVTIRSLSIPQGQAHFVLSKPYVIFTPSREMVTDLVDRVEAKNKGLNEQESFRRFSSRQRGGSDVILYMPFGETGAADQLPEGYQETFQGVRAFGASYTLPSTNELLEDSVFLPTEGTSPRMLQNNLEQLLGTVKRDLAERVSTEIQLDVEFRIEEDLVLGKARVLGFGSLISEFLTTWTKTFLPTMDPASLPGLQPAKEPEDPAPESLEE